MTSGFIHWISSVQFQNASSLFLKECEAENRSTRCHHPNNHGGPLGHMTTNETKFMDAAVALSEELNFTRAAKRVGISQSAITKIVRELEATLGVTLFERDRRSVRATDACRAYIEQARLSLLYAERAFQVARSVAQGAETILHIGYSPYTDPFLLSLLKSIQLPVFPLLKLHITSQYSFDLVHQVMAGSLDLAIVNEPPESPMLSVLKIEESPFFVGMSVRDKLAKQPSLVPQDLSGRQLVMFDRNIKPLLYDFVMGSFDRSEVRFKQVQQVLTPEEVFPHLVRGERIALLTKNGAVRISREGVTIRPLLAESITLKTYLVSRSDNGSRVMSELVRSFMRRLESLRKPIPPSS